MQLKFISIFIFVFSMNITQTAYAQRLVWADEFNRDGLPDSSKWTYDIGTGENGWGNNESQFYTSSIKNAFVKNGLLNIRAIKEPTNGMSFSSARLLTKGKYSFRYGVVEVRAKLPKGGGAWPAIWMLGNNIEQVGWPNSGEIDIMEHKGNEMNNVYGTFHYPKHFGANADGKTKMVSGISDDFHIYKLDWSAQHLKIFVDGQLVHQLSNHDKLPFQHDFFILLNFAVGGHFGGEIDSNFSDATLEIDYVRVFQ